MKFEAAIFDMDGVIVDTVPLHFKAWKKMADKYGRPFTFEDYKQKVDGIPRVKGCRAILGPDTDEKTVKRACDLKQRVFLNLLNQDDIPIYETTFKLIDDLQSRGISVACISSSKNAPTILTRVKLIDRLDATVTGLDGLPGKPKPDVFLEAAKRMNKPAGGSVVLEDAVLGVQAAKRAKMACVGIDRYKQPDRLKGADIVVSDLGEVDYERLRNLVEK